MTIVPTSVHHHSVAEHVTAVGKYFLSSFAEFRSWRSVLPSVPTRYINEDVTA
jgi:hypothetical protein